MAWNNSTISPGPVNPVGYRPWLKFHTMTIYDSNAWTQDSFLRWNNSTMSFDVYKINSASLSSSGILCWDSGSSEFSVVPFASFSPPLTPPMESVAGLFAESPIQDEVELTEPIAKKATTAKSTVLLNKRKVPNFK